MTTENQTHIPEGWKECELGELLDYKQPYKYIVTSTEYSKNTGIPVLTAGKSFILGYTDESENIYNDLPVVIFDDFTTDSKYVDFPFKVKSSAMKFLLPKNEIDLFFVFAHLQRLRFRDVSGDHKRMWISEFSKLNIVLPTSPTEQQKIASILSKLDEAITQTEQLIAKYKKIKEGLMHDLLTRGIDEQGNIRSEETHKFKDSPLGRIPEEWEYSSLSTIYELRTGTTPLRANENYFSEKGYNWAKTLDLNEYYINSTEEKVTDLALERTSLKLMPQSTILVAMYGGWEQIGRTSILNVEAGTNQAIVSLCNPKNQLQSEFTLFFLQENRWRWKQYAVSTRKDPNITKDDVAKFIIAYPKSEKEQKDIVRIIQKVHNQIDLYKEQYLKYNLEKSGIMHDLLTGKVRVSNCEEKKEQTSNVIVDTLKKQAHNQHIEDAVLIGAIVNAFYSDKYTLGRKKIQKLLYLVRRHQEASVACFKKKAAGPYADEVRYKGGEPIAKANKYITTKTNDLGTTFSKGENIEKALAYIEKWEMLSDIDWLLTQFKYTKVDQLELIATIDMARCDLEKEGIPVSLSTIKHLIATNEEWKAKLKKEHFDDFSIQRGIDESYKLFGE
jgi:type I restriction enzyme S subunit